MNVVVKEGRERITEIAAGGQRGRLEHGLDLKLSALQDTDGVGSRLSGGM